jgi:UDP-4-amino-4,6-dideoxy-N-acetyl-beta-L-altrosamine N-acetyltransferase
MNQKTEIQLKQITKSDLKLLIEWRNSKNIFPYNTQYFLLNSKIQTDWFKSLQNDSSRKMFMISYKKIKIGICGLIDVDYKNKNANIAIIIGKTNLHAQGLGTMTLHHLLNYGFKKLNLHRIGAEIIEYNQNSIHFFKKSQFKIDAIHRDVIWRNNQWRSIYSMSILKDDFNKNHGCY